MRGSSSCSRACAKVLRCSSARGRKSPPPELACDRRSTRLFTICEGPEGKRASVSADAERSHEDVGQQLACASIFIQIGVVDRDLETYSTAAVQRHLQHRL